MDAFDKPLDAPRGKILTGGIVGLGEKGDSRRRMMTMLERRELEAEEKLAEAHRKLEDAERSAEQIQRDAYTAGFEQGEKAGLKLADQKAGPLVQTIEQLIDALQVDRRRLVEEHEGELVKIAFAISVQVIREQIEMKPEVVTKAVEAALEKIGDRTAIGLRISPLDFQLVKSYIERREGEMWNEEHLRIETDETIARGGCRVETPTGDIDATIETQLRVLRSLLWNE